MPTEIPTSSQAEPRRRSSPPVVSFICLEMRAAVPPEALTSPIYLRRAVVGLPRASTMRLPCSSTVLPAWSARAIMAALASVPNTFLKTSARSPVPMSLVLALISSKISARGRRLP